MRRKDREHRAPARAGGGLRRRCADHSVTRRFKSLSGPIILSALSFPFRSTNAITDPNAGHESGDQSAPVGSSDKIIRGHAGVTPRELRGVPLSTVPRHLLSRQSRSRSSQAFAKDQVGGRSSSGAKVKRWTLGKLATVYAWMSSAQSFQDLRAVD